MKYYLKKSIGFISLIVLTLNYLSLFGQVSGPGGGLDISIPIVEQLKSTDEEGCMRPKYIAPSNLTHNSVSFSWLPVKNALNQNYIMYLKSNTDFTITEYKIKGTFKRFTNLTPNTSYEINLHAVCGESSFSDPYTVKFYTLPVPELESPTGITLESTTHRSAVLSWNFAKGAKSYEVSYRSSTEKSFKSVEINNLSVELDGLDSRSLYEVRVASLNGEKKSNLITSNFTFWTLPSYVASLFLTPSNLRVQKSGSSALLQWQGHKSINRYNVFISKDNGKTFEHYLTVQQPNAIISDLETDKVYKMKVEAVGSGETDSPMSEVVTFKLEGDSNPVPADLGGGVSISPDRVSNELDFAFKYPYQGEVKIIVNDLLGKKVLEKEGVAESGRYSIPDPKFARGLYKVFVLTRKEHLTSELAIK